MPTLEYFGHVRGALMLWRMPLLRVTRNGLSLRHGILLITPFGTLTLA